MELKKGLNLADRRSGKTTALLHILHKDPTYVFVSCNLEGRKFAQERYKELYPLSDEMIFVVANSPKGLSYELTKIGKSKAKLLMDEYTYFNDPPEIGPEDIATGTPPYQVTIHHTVTITTILSEAEWSNNFVENLHNHKYGS